MESTLTDLDTMLHHQATRACQARVLISERRNIEVNQKEKATLLSHRHLVTQYMAEEERMQAIYRRNRPVQNQFGY